MSRRSSWRLGEEDPESFTTRKDTSAENLFRELDRQRELHAAELAQEQAEKKKKAEREEALALGGLALGLAAVLWILTR